MMWLRDPRTGAQAGPISRSDLGWLQQTTGRRPMHRLERWVVKRDRKGTPRELVTRRLKHHELGHER